jgi:hypothetical protein
MTVTFSKTGLVNATIRDEEGERVGTVSVRAENLLNEIMEMQEDARRYRAKYRPGAVNYSNEPLALDTFRAERCSDGPAEAEPLDAYRDALGAPNPTRPAKAQDDAAYWGRKVINEDRVAAIEEAHAKERDTLAFRDPSKEFTNAAKLVLAVFDVAVEIAETQAQTVERARAMDKLRALTGKRS